MLLASANNGHRYRVPPAIIREDDTVQTATKNLFLGCAPERKDDLEQLWQQYSPKFQLTEDIDEGENIIMEAGAYRLVRYNHRVLRSFWLAGYAAWEAYVAAHRALTEDTSPALERLSSHTVRRRML